MCELFSNLTQSDKNKKSKYYHKVFLCNCTIFDAISEMIKCFLPFVLPNFHPNPCRRVESLMGCFNLFARTKLCNKRHQDMEIGTDAVF